MIPDRIRHPVGCALGVGLVLGLAVCAAAQESRGPISGKVVDPSKGVVPGATVTITNVAMGTTVTVVTNDVGLYQAPYLIPGSYRIVAECPGSRSTCATASRCASGRRSIWS